MVEEILLKELFEMFFKSIWCICDDSLLILDIELGF